MFISEIAKTRFQTLSFKQKVHEVKYILKRPMICPSVDIPYFSNARHFGFNMAQYYSERSRGSAEYRRDRESASNPSSPRHMSRDKGEGLRSFSFERLASPNIGIMLTQHDYLLCPVVRFANELSVAKGASLKRN